MAGTQHKEKGGRRMNADQCLPSSSLPGGLGRLFHCSCEDDVHKPLLKLGPTHYLSLLTTHRRQGRRRGRELWKKQHRPQETQRLSAWDLSERGGEGREGRGKGRDETGEAREGRKGGRESVCHSSISHIWSLGLDTPKHSSIFHVWSLGLDTKDGRTGRYGVT